MFTKTFFAPAIVSINMLLATGATVTQSTAQSRPEPKRKQI